MGGGFQGGRTVEVDWNAVGVIESFLTVVGESPGGGIISEVSRKCDINGDRVRRSLCCKRKIRKDSHELLRR
jgi:hypothetical protein